MQNRNLALIITAATALLCGCGGIISCVWGALIVSGTPVNVTRNGVTTPEYLSPSLGYSLLCLALILVLIPAGVGFFSLRRRAEAENQFPPTL